MFKKSILIALLIAILLLPVFPGAQQIPADLSRLQPALRQMAAQDGGRLVQVIVQGADGAKEHALALGGKITQDLSIIHAFAVELPAAAAARLAASPQVRWVSLDAAVERSRKKTTTKEVTNPTSRNTYLDTLNVPEVWAQGLTGAGIGVAVIDSGIADNPDFQTIGDPTVNRIVARYNLTTDRQKIGDSLGHGTHIAGIIGGNGAISSGVYSGIAPGVNLISLRVSNNEGMATESGVIAALQFVLEHKEAFNIRVVNLSINSTVEQSYHTSPLDAACEILWFNGIVVVVSAGNSGPDEKLNHVKAPPANDPFVITVGATDELGTGDRNDDVRAAYSAYGTTGDGFKKPEVMAPGSNIISVTPPDAVWSAQYPKRIVDRYYFRASGTSMAAPMVSGVIALMLQDDPNLTPDQVKSLLMLSATDTKAMTLNAYQAVNADKIKSAPINAGIQASQLLWTGDEPVTWDSVAWNSVAWNSVAWNSVAWNSVAWNSVAWNSVAWNSVYFEP